MRWHNLDNKEFENEINSFINELSNESDRGCALVGLAVIDELLKEVLQAFLADVPTTEDLLNQAHAPLKDLSARIKVSYSLGLISKFEYTSLDLLRKIRNEFAHKSHGVTFESAEIAKLCDKIKLESTFLKEEGRITQGWGKQRGMFFLSVIEMFSSLGIRSRKVMEQKRQITEWITK